MTYESFNQGYETGFINRIADIYVPGKNDTNRAKWQAPPNIAIIKLRIPIAFKYNVQPICLPEVNEIITVDHRCFFYRFSRIGYTVSYFMPLGLKHSSMLVFLRWTIWVPDGSSLICKKRDPFFFFWSSRLGYGFQNRESYPPSNCYIYCHFSVCKIRINFLVNSTSEVPF
ncbi:conserved hypothetical protein [Trichinella spiralis]|uniref:hypothetical protein n=1 Tax=Trichinella spiralis TaxID=6334 RepID=UPI0001EFDB06|nr:conserved hypothetical protein [Trichinella spiralis]